MKMTRGKTLFKLKGDESNNPAESIKKKRAVSAVTPKTPSNKKRPKIKSKPFVSFSTKKVNLIRAKKNDFIQYQNTVY